MKLKENNKVLKEVVKKEDCILIVIKKDTIEYNAKVFRIKPNINVEKLLKQLPRIQVDQDTQIATKNLPADAIKKVQASEEKSEVSKLIEVDVGELGKTINLILKKGFFGNVLAGYGTNCYNDKFNLNRFSCKIRILPLAGTNNTNKQPFSFVNYVGGFKNISRGAINNIRSGESSGLSALLWLNSSQALANTQVMSVNFNRGLSKKTNLPANYFYNFIGNDINQVIDWETFIDSSTFFTNTTRDQASHNWNHQMNICLRL